ncbi:GntR family transcriptional regulator [Sporolactobacillus laevolacticus]|uniref:GntR family transcriptional regulator n=1 Tax=Sporolactobacillus laevolacticus DSM 442 TaxID=1395513 RepID=V6IWM5_9BACL|nr:GntR family transcriptional regulator [Sporolactobacillus laevolacticus]EST11635.1 GntR family transcriptional regulator [Sporolactobacillus laevolacticus DSM 442]
MDIILLNTADQPIYQQIKSQMITQILNGQLPEGEKLPSIRGLAKELKISVITTKRAYEELENEGFIDTVPGKGSFVSSRDRDMLRERQLQEIQDRLKLIVEEGKKYDMSMDKMIHLIKKWYGED